MAIVDTAAGRRPAVELARALKRHGSTAKLVLLAPADGRGSVSDALVSGVAGFVSRAADAQEIRAAVLAVGRGGTVISQRVRARLLAEIDPEAAQRSPRLSSRETQVLSLAADGSTNGEIGAELHLSEATIKTHLARTYDKLGVANKPAATAVAVRLGLIE